MLAGLIVRSSGIHAAGCYTMKRIRRGVRILEYDGLRLAKKLADERYAGRNLTYLFSFGEDGTVIDGFGTAMFLNHCCEPNCETEEDNGRIFIVALRDIAAGEELTYEYNLHDSDDEPGLCFCGAAGCRGTMFSEAEVKRRERRERARSRRQTASKQAPARRQHPAS